MPTEQLQGTVLRLTFTNPETGFFIAAVQVPGVGERTVKGIAPSINLGELLSAQGSWERTSYGPAFKATQVLLSPPKQLGEIVKFLSSALDGVGPKFAQKLVDSFGAGIFDVIEKSPEKLRDVPGVGKKRVESLLASYNETKDLREIMFFLHQCGMGPASAKRVYDAFKDKEKNSKSIIQKIKANPYILCKEVWGFGFLKADEVAKKQGIEATAEFRVRAGISHVVRMSESSGSCGVPLASRCDVNGDVIYNNKSGKPRYPGLLDAAYDLLGVDYELIEKCLGYEVSAGELYRDEDGSGLPCVFSKHIYEAERFIADYCIKAIQRSVPASEVTADESIMDAELDTGIILEDSQRSALKRALGSRICVITGGPGCGKTTITNLLLRVFKEQKLVTVLAAPTGKAAKRAAEATGHFAATVHRTFDFKEGKFSINAQNTLDADVLLLDESSMLDVVLMKKILEGLGAHTRLILIGDVDQLPSVSPGKVLSDLIESGVIPVARLTTIFRQGKGSAIIRNAHAINKGFMPDMGYHEGSDFCFFNFQPRSRDDEDEKERVRTALKNELVRMARDSYKRGFDPIRDVQVYSPMRKGGLGIEELNRALQKALNPRPAATLDVFGTTWGVGDKVMQLKNNKTKNVFNGDVGFIQSVDPSTRSLTVDFDDVIVTYKGAELEELTLAYAITIHKSQGSESPMVLIAMDYSHFTMLKRNLLYTAVTRAKKLCVLLGDKEAVKRAVENNQNDDRHTRLKQLLQAGVAKATQLEDEAVPA